MIVLAVGSLTRQGVGFSHAYRPALAGGSSVNSTVGRCFLLVAACEDVVVLALPMTIRLLVLASLFLLVVCPLFLQYVPRSMNG